MVLTGLNNVKRQSELRRRLIGAGIERGLKKAGLHVQRKSQEIVPVDLGGLKASAYTRKISGSGASTVVAVGYTAEYAGAVHEDADKAHGRIYNLKYAKEIANRSRYYRNDLDRWVAYRKRGENQTSHYLYLAVLYNYGQIHRIVKETMLETAFPV